MARKLNTIKNREVYDLHGHFKMIRGSVMMTRKADKINILTTYHAHHDNSVIIKALGIDM